MDIPSTSSFGEISTGSNNPETFSSSPNSGDIENSQPVSGPPLEPYSICRRLWMQRGTWFEYIKEHGRKFLVWFFLKLVVLVLMILRFVYPIDYPAVFTAVATVVYICSFTYYWVTIPEGPNYLAPENPPIEKTNPTGSTPSSNQS